MNPFERLSDDLLENILMRRLWNPFDVTARKGRERVWLGAVCKRFHRLVCSQGSLDWVVEDNHSAGDLVQYMLAHGDCKVSFKRVCLTWSSVHIACCVMSGLLWLIPQVAGTLEEFRLFIDVGANYQQLYCLDWDPVFMLLQTCKQLRTVDIILWNIPPHTSDNLSRFARVPSKPFPSLRSLSLYGFGLPGPDLVGTISKTFPLLENLEVQCVSGAMTGNESFPLQLKKFFVWGDGAVEFDRLNPESVHVPRSMDMLLSLLTNGEWHVDAIPLVEKLRYLTKHSSEALKLIATTLGGMPGLMRSLRTSLQWVYNGLKEYLIESLTTMFPEEEVCQLFIQAPRVLRIGSEL